MALHLVAVDAPFCSYKHYCPRIPSRLLSSSPSQIFPSTYRGPLCMVSGNSSAFSEGSITELTPTNETPLSSKSSAAFGFYTSVKDDPLQFWETRKALQESIDNGRSTLEEADDQMLLAELQWLANAAADRAQMHNILAQQRDNWNSLFQRFVTMATMTATVLSGLHGQQHSLSLSLPAFVLNAGCAVMMAVINQFQPSQLAEEQRIAVRLFTELINDIYCALSVSPALRQDTAALLQDSQRRLQALDRAFPMELTPGGLEKFPKRVVPPVLSHRRIDPSEPAKVTPCEADGWTESVTRELAEVATRLHDSDVHKYISWAQNVVKVNKCLAIAAPLFALSGAALNAVDALGCNSAMSVPAAVCSVLAAFAASFSHDMQLGMVFEMYRNSAGYYAEVKEGIERSLRTPVHQRENGELFRRRVGYKLGRAGEQGRPLVPPEAETAGTLF